MPRPEQKPAQTDKSAIPCLAEVAPVAIRLWLQRQTQQARGYVLLFLDGRRTEDPRRISVYRGQKKQPAVCPDDAR